MPAQEQYRLQALMEIRERAKDDAQRILGERMAELETEQERLKQMERELERMIARREAKKREYAEKAMRGELSAQSAVSANLYVDRLEEQEQMQEDAIESQKGVVVQREEAVAEARAELVEASQELKALEKHKDKWAQERKNERAKKEAQAEDEIAQTIFLSRDRPDT